MSDKQALTVKGLVAEFRRAARVFASSSEGLNRLLSDLYDGSADILSDADNLSGNLKKDIELLINERLQGCREEISSLSLIDYKSFKVDIEKLVGSILSIPQFNNLSFSIIIPGRDNDGPGGSAVPRPKPPPTNPSGSLRIAKHMPLSDEGGRKRVPSLLYG